MVRNSSYPVGLTESNLSFQKCRLRQEFLPSKVHIGLDPKCFLFS